MQDYGARHRPFVPWSLSPCEGWWEGRQHGEVLLAAWGLINVRAQACQLTARVSLPLSTERHQQRESEGEKNPYNPTGGLIFSIHKRAPVWIHRKFCARSQIPPRLWPRPTHVDEERASVRSCGGLSGSEQSLPEGPGTSGADLEAWQQRTNDDKQTNKQTDGARCRNTTATPSQSWPACASALCSWL